MSDGRDDGGGHCENVTTGLEPTPSCAEPEFDTSPPTAPTEYRCEGKAGGAIAYQQVIITVAGDDKGGPGVIQTDPAETVFPSTGNEVSACCHDLDPAQNPADEAEIRDNACQRDCARAACNRILASLRDAADSNDPSNGKCNPLPEGPFRDNCRDNVRESLEAWIGTIATKYHECVEKAIANGPGLPYTDASIAFHEDRRVKLADPSCNTNDVGCLHNAELRPFCQIDDFSALGTCSQAGNPIDPEATGDGGVVDDTGEPAGSPFGDIQTLVYCNPQTTCLIESELTENVGRNFHVFWEEDVVMTLGTFGTGVTGLQIDGLSAGDYAKELLDAFGIGNSYVITHVNSTPLDSWSNIIDVVEDIESTSYWEVTVRRLRCGPFGCSWQTLNYEISRAVSFGGGATKTEDPTLLAGGDGDASTREGRGCGCREGSPSRGGAILACVMFGLGVMRSQSRRPVHWT